MNDEMRPGYEMDRLVVERVLGWQEGMQFHVHRWHGDSDSRIAVCLLDANGKCHGEDFSPSLVLDDAMIVAERWASYEIHKNLDDDPAFRYCVETYAPYAAPIARLAETLPHAISLLALAVKDEEELR